MKTLRLAIGLSIMICCYQTAVIKADIAKSRTKRIVGGSPVPIESFPFIVSLRAPIEDNFKHFCGGSMLNPLIILTAAHCVARYPVNSTKIQVGSHLVLPPYPRRFDIVEAIRHENYSYHSKQENSSMKYDIALLRLKSPITQMITNVSSVGNLTVPKSVTLFGRNETVPEGSVATVIGWGAIEEPGENAYRPQIVLKQLANGTWVRESLFPEKLKGVEVQTVSSEWCSKNYDDEVFGEDRLCAYYPGRDSCDGDSGGPLMIGGAQAGIVSAGEDCAEKDSPGIYTSVAFFRDWIDRNVEILLARAAM